MTYEGLGVHRHRCATSLASASLCPSSPLSLLYTPASSASRSLVCPRDQKLLLDINSKLCRNASTCLRCPPLIQSTHPGGWGGATSYSMATGILARSWWSGQCSMGDHYSSQYVSQAYFLTRGKERVAELCDSIGRKNKSPVLLKAGNAETPKPRRKLQINLDHGPRGSGLLSSAENK